MRTVIVFGADDIRTALALWIKKELGVDVAPHTILPMEGAFKARERGEYYLPETSDAYAAVAGAIERKEKGE